MAENLRCPYCGNIMTPPVMKKFIAKKGLTPHHVSDCCRCGGRFTRPYKEDKK